MYIPNKCFILYFTRRTLQLLTPVQASDVEWLSALGYDV